MSNCATKITIISKNYSLFLTCFLRRPWLCFFILIANMIRLSQVPWKNSHRVISIPCSFLVTHMILWKCLVYFVSARWGMETLAVAPMHSFPHTQDLASLGITAAIRSSGSICPGTLPLIHRIHTNLTHSRPQGANFFIDHLSFQTHPFWLLPSRMHASRTKASGCLHKQEAPNYSWESTKPRSDFPKKWRWKRFQIHYLNFLY